MSTPPHGVYGNLPRGYVIRQPGYSIQTQRTGLATARERYIGYYDDIVSGKPIQLLNTTTPASRNYKSSHPFYPSMLVFSAQVTAQTGIVNGVLEIEYRGLDPALNAIPPPVYSLDRSTSTEPISTHPKWKSDIAGTPSAALNGAQFIDPATGAISTDDNTAVFSGWTAKDIPESDPNFYGIESFLKAGAVWTCSYTSYSPPTNGDMSSVGQISSPQGNPPTPDGYVWLYLGCKYTDNAGLFSIDKSWRCFQDNPASEIIYRG